MHLGQFAHTLTDGGDGFRLDLLFDIFLAHQTAAVTAGLAGADNGIELCRIRHLDGIDAVALKIGGDMPDRFACHDIAFPMIKGDVAGAPLEALDLTQIDVIDSLSVGSLTAGEDLLTQRGRQSLQPLVAAGKQGGRS